MRPILRDPTFVSALVYFERVATHSSFTRAAEELGVTPSAISHRIKALETELGHRLFNRSPRAVSLTEAGSRLHMASRSAFSTVDLALADLLKTVSLRVSIGPYLSVAWLMPRLARFEARHPGIRVELVHRIGAPNLRDVDLAIYWARESDVPGEAVRLFSPRMKPVVAPGFDTGSQVWDLGIPPLHYRSRTPWQAWLRTVSGPESFASQGEVIDDPNLVLEAAAHGRGTALGFAPFIDQHIDIGRLVSIGSQSVNASESYWLLKGVDSGRDVSAFRDWLLTEMQ